MKKDRSLKQRILAAVMAIVMLTSSLIGTTFAWFTDSVTSDNNVIQTGKLDAQMHWSDELLDYDSDEWNNAEGGAPVFNYNNWEPGYTEVKYVKVSNAGSLNFKWKLSIEANGAVSILGDVIDVYYVNPVSNQLTSLDGLTSVGKLADVLASKTATSGELTPGGNQIIAIAFHMDELAGNEYQNTALCDGGFSLKLLATQATGEFDSFGDDYDAGVTFPDFKPVEGITGSVTTHNNVVTEKATLSGTNAEAVIPEGVLVNDGVGELTFSVTQKDKSESNVTTDDGEELKALDVHVEGVSSNNTKPIIITIDKAMAVGFNVGNYNLYHVENGVATQMTRVDSIAELDAHNEYYYDPATGDIMLAMATFSEVALVADNENAWEGNFDYTWYDASKTELTIANADQLAAFGAIVGGMVGQKQDSFAGKTVKLLADINLGDDEENNKSNLIFYPIGYYNSEGTYERTNTAITSGLRIFEGIFDGNGNTIANFYQNTWEMKGDHDWYSPEEQYYRDGMGLFGRVYGGTIKNLTVKNFSSDGEIATTGVIAAYADGATFENIAIFGCNPRVYNIGNGGIVGCVGWYAKEANLKTTFTNITVDNSNKISALWGSYDVACGGIVGQYYPTSGQSSANYPQNAGIHFDNCHISAIMDVYNDVCANYQYYAYRYAGMLIGSVRENVTVDGHVYPKMDGISAKDCTVHFGTWNDYYYCEFEKNGHPSYSGPDDYKFSRIEHSEINFTDSNGNGIIDTDDERASVTGCKHEHTAAEEDNKAVYLPFNNLVTGYGWGVTTKVVGELDGVKILDREEANSVEKFSSTVETLTTNRVYTLDEIFSYIENCGVKIVDGALNVTIRNLDENGNVIATFTRGEKWNEGTISFENTGKIEIVIQDYYFCTPTTITVDVTERQKEEKFDVVMNNGDFLHRVGNVGTVALDKLFAAKDGVKVGTVFVTVEAVNGTAASGTYSNNAIKFNGTGVVKVTIKDDDEYCIPTELYLEVVDAVNATSATSAKSNNVVLLNDAGFSSLEVSGGYTLYGNGFTLTCGSDSYAVDRTYAFVELKGGTLDNVKIITPNFSHAVMYDKNKEEGGNPSNTDSSGRTRYYNIRSAVVVTADSNITNSYISGGRAAIYAISGTLNVKNSTVYGGAVANIQTEASSNLILEDVTLIQKPIKANVNDTNKTLMGLSVLTMCDSAGVGAPITLKGYLYQYAWAHEGYAQYVPSDAKDAISEIMSNKDYIHSIVYDDGIAKDSVNLGFVYMSNGITASKADNMKDERSSTIEYPYDMVTVKIVAVYTYKNTNGTGDDVKIEPTYTSTTQGVVAPTIKYEDTNENRVFTTTYDEAEGAWKSTLKVDVDAGAYTFSFAKLLAQKYGNNLSYSVKTKDGTVVDTNTAITLNSAVSNVYYLTITDNQIYDKNGNLTGKSVEITYIFELQSTKTSLPAPTWTSTTLNGTPYIVVDSKDGDWNCAVPVLDGLKVKYWSKKQNKEIELDLANVVSAAGLGKGLQNGSNNTITITVADEYTLKITTTGFKTNDNGKPVVVNGKLYFTVSSSSNYVSTKTTDRTPNISYVFTDANNSESISLSRSKTVTYATYKSKQYKYSDFCNGTLTEASCVTPDTLITLADGTQVRVDSLKGDELLLVWNMETGQFDYAPIMFVDSEAEAEFEVVKLYFSDGTEVKVIGEHGFWDYDLNKYVYLDRNAADYIGHTFAKQNGDSLEKVTLVDVVIETELTTAWSPVTVGHLCYFVNGMLSMPGGVGGLFNIFEVDSETMTYDYEQIEKDIETYGLFTYEELNAICPLTEEMFNAAGGAYLKISIGKGNLTLDELIAMINRYSKYI